MKRQVFAPGCALFLYKPHLADRLHEFLSKEPGVEEMHRICCIHEPRLPEGTEIINVCSGCDRRFGNDYEGITTVSLWTLLAESNFDFPDYGGAEITVHDACPTRHKTHVHKAVRKMLERMNFTIVESEYSGTSAFCCGDSFHPKKSKEFVLEQMKKRADSMPVENVAVYCVSCIKSMANGGKTPRYLLDLIFNEKTEPMETDPVLWHESLTLFQGQNLETV